jgi:ferrous iron transport protein B
MKIALVGNQNSGKTTLFNLLTGMHAKIGNWPGVTIEKKTGKIKGTKHDITDLPGIYSLSPYSIEEDISRKYVFEDNPDIIINIVDTTQLERSLYLTTQLLELDSHVIVVLNMADILEDRGITIDTKELSKLLGTPVILVSALKGTGINDLLKEIDKMSKTKEIKIYDSNIEKAISNIEKELKEIDIHKRFVAVKLLEDDDRFKKYNNKKIDDIRKKVSLLYETDLEETIATERYDFVSDTRNKVFKKSKTSKKISKTDKLDKIFLNKWLALPIFIAIMFLIYFLSVGVVGSFTVDLIGEWFESFGEIIGTWLNSIGASNWVVSLIVDGIIAGVGAVLGFVPQLIIMFLCISILETTGYMSRISLFLDKVFRKIGLSGKSLIPFIVGSGCSVPGIMGARIIENQDEREMTTILTPFIPCSAKLPIISLFSGYFFGKNSGLISFSLYCLAIIIIILTALLLKKFIYKNTSSTYISELPEYRLPSIKYVFKDVFDKVIAFIKRAGTIILLCSMVIWFLLSFNFKLQYGVNVEDSILAKTGDKISFVFEPMLGEKSWGATVSAIQGLVAKEQVVSSMSIIAGFDEEGEADEIFGENSTFAFFTPIAAYAFMIFNLFSAPCFGAIGAMARELGSKRKMLKAVTFQTGYAWLIATIFYQVASRINGVNLANVIIVSLLILIVILIIVRTRKHTGCENCPYCDKCGR